MRFVPEQVPTVPVPLNPGKHSQLNETLLLMHKALTSQLWVPNPHSSVKSVKVSNWNITIKESIYSWTESGKISIWILNIIQYQCLWILYCRLQDAKCFSISIFRRLKFLTWKKVEVSNAAQRNKTYQYRKTHFQCNRYYRNNCKETVSYYTRLLDHNGEFQ